MFYSALLTHAARLFSFQGTTQRVKRWPARTADALFFDLLLLLYRCYERPTRYDKPTSEAFKWYSMLYLPKSASTSWLRGLLG